MILRYHIALRLAHLGMPCTLVFLLGKMSLHSLNEYIHELYCLNAIYIKHKQMSVGQLFIKYIKFIIVQLIYLLIYSRSFIEYVSCVSYFSNAHGTVRNKTCEALALVKLFFHIYEECNADQRKQSAQIHIHFKWRNYFTVLPYKNFSG